MRPVHAAGGASVSDVIDGVVTAGGAVGDGVVANALVALVISSACGVVVLVGGGLQAFPCDEPPLPSSPPTDWV